MAVLLKSKQVLSFHQISTLYKHLPLRPWCRCLLCITLTLILKERSSLHGAKYGGRCALSYAYRFDYLAFPWLWVLHFSFLLSTNAISNCSTLQFSICWRSPNTVELTGNEAGRTQGASCNKHFAIMRKRLKNFKCLSPVLRWSSTHWCILIRA